MHISEILNTGKTSFSFEFFPPKTQESSERLYKAIEELSHYNPSFVSVTYGAGGATRELTHDLVVRIKETIDVTPVPHLTCIGHTKEELKDILVRYASVGVSNVLALRGDPPEGEINYDHSKDTFTHASGLVRFIKELDLESRHLDSRGFGIGVAGFPEGHPAVSNRMKEMDYLKRKVDEGADYICTQLFFDNHDFLDFRERCELAGINIPIIAGIMPVTSLSGMQRMADLAAGTRYPAKLIKALNRADEDPDAVRRIGVHYASQQCSELLDAGVAGIHFYTLNQSRATMDIYANLGITK